MIVTLLRECLNSPVSIVVVSSEVKVKRLMQFAISLCWRSVVTLSLAMSDQSLRFDVDPTRKAMQNLISY